MKNTQVPCTSVVMQLKLRKCQRQNSQTTVGADISKPEYRCTKQTQIVVLRYTPTIVIFCSSAMVG